MELQPNHQRHERRTAHRIRSAAASRWFKHCVPQNLVSQGGKCSPAKCVREDRMNGMRKKSEETLLEEDRPEIATEVLYLCSYEGCGKAFIDAMALRKHSHVHGERQYVHQSEGRGKVKLASSLTSHLAYPLSDGWSSISDSHRNLEVVSDSDSDSESLEDDGTKFKFLWEGEILALMSGYIKDALRVLKVLNNEIVNDMEQGRRMDFKSLCRRLIARVKLLDRQKKKTWTCDILLLQSGNVVSLTYTNQIQDKYSKIWRGQEWKTASSQDANPFTLWVLGQEWKTASSQDANPLLFGFWRPRRC